MGRAPCCDKANVKKGPWAPEEDAKLKEFIEKYGTGGNWIALPQKAGLKRCGKSCRLRWLNYLRPNIKHGEFSDDEDRIICSMYASIGSRWSIIAAQLPGRTDNDIKNYWNTKLKKKLLAMLPSIPKKPSYFQNIPLQSPPPQPLSYDHQRTDQFMSSSFYNYTPNFMNFNTTNTLLTATTTNALVNDDHDQQLPNNNHINIPDLSSPTPANTLTGLMTANNLNVNDSCYYPGFEDDNQNMYNNPMQEYYYPASSVKEGMLMFGGGGHEVSTTGSSSEGGSCMSQISYGNYKDHQKQHQIKQEDQVTLQGFGDQSHSFMIDHSYSDQKPRGYLRNYVASPLHNDLEEVKRLIINNNSSNSSSYLFNDDDENKTAHDQKGMMCYYY